MATSGSFQSNNEKYCNLYVEWKVTGQSVANNTSTVQVDVYLKHHALNIPSKTLTINFGSTVKNITTPAINIGSSANTTKLGSATLTAWHNANGTKSLTIGVTMPIAAYCDSTYFESVTASGSATFNQIARPTTPTLSASTVELGKSVTITMSRNISSLTHTLTYSIGNNSGTIGSSLATSKAWTPAIELAHQITESASGVVTITCKTYSGSTLIGTKTVTLTVTVPASVVPSVTNLEIADSAGCFSKYGSFVQNQSKLLITVDGAGAYSSTIARYKVEANGITTTLKAAGSVNAGVLSTAGTYTVKVTVTDSRGRTASATGKVSAIEYIKPKASVKAYRCDSNGTENPEGAYIKATISGSITALNNKNSKTFKIQYKTASATSYTDALTYTSAYTCSSSKVFAADINTVYNVRVIATDDFGESTNTVDVSTSYTIIDFKADGKGIAFGKVSTQAGLDVGMAATFRNGMVFEKDSNINFKGEHSSKTMIRFMDAADAYGNGIVIGGGGLTIIGGGESAGTMAGQYTNGSIESMLVCNDSNINFYSNCNGGAASAKQFIMDTSGTFSAPNDVIAMRGATDQCGLIETNELAKGAVVDNLLGYPYSEGTVTKDGITFTDNGDGTITLNGTATADMTYSCKTYGDSTHGLFLGLKKGEKYTLHGCPAGGSTDTYCLNMAFRNGSTTLSGRKYDTGEGVVIDTNSYLEADRFQVVIWVQSGTTLNNLTFKPMIEPGIVKHTWQPYKLSRQNLLNKDLFKYKTYDISNYTANTFGNVAISTIISSWANIGTVLAVIPCGGRVSGKDNLATVTNDGTYIRYTCGAAGTLTLYFLVASI